MKHTVRVGIDKGKDTDGIVSCEQVGVRERLMRFLLGKKERLTILIPGSSVETVAITEVKEEADEALRD